MAYPDAVGTSAVGGTPLPTPNPILAALNRFTPYYQAAMKNDDIYTGTLQQIIAGLRASYLGDVISPAQQALIAYGGDVNAPELQARVAKYGAPNLPWAPETALGTTSLATALADPNTNALAQQNPLSAIATLTRQIGQQRLDAGNRAAESGMSYSGAVPAYQYAASQNELLGRASALQDFLKQINAGYDTYKTDAGTAMQGYQQAGSDLYGRVNQLIGAGMSGGPVKPKATPAAPVRPYTPVERAAQVTRANQQASRGYFTPNVALPSSFVMPTAGNFGTLPRMTGPYGVSTGVGIRTPSTPFPR